MGDTCFIGLSSPHHPDDAIDFVGTQREMVVTGFDKSNHRRLYVLACEEARLVR